MTMGNIIILDYHIASVSTYHFHMRTYAGITWTRLQGIAIKSPAEGGLALFADGTMEFYRIFRKGPIKLIDDRPECTFLFIKWLLPIEPTLKKLVKKDLETRDLTFKQAARALATLESRL